MLKIKDEELSEACSTFWHNTKLWIMVILYDPVKGSRSFTRQKSNQNVLRITRIRRTKMREPGVLNLSNFTEDKITPINDPLSSIGIVGQYDNAPKSSHISEQVFFHAFFTTNKQCLKSLFKLSFKNSIYN